MDLQNNTQDIAPIPNQSGLPNWLVILLLIIAYPIGLLVMWLFAAWSKKIKLFITLTPIVLIILLWLIIIASLNQSNNKIGEQIGIPRQENITANSQDKGNSIYSNSNLGYSVSYPSNWRVSESSYDSQYKTQLVVFDPPDHIPAVRGIRIDINNEPNLNYKTLDNYINGIQFYTPITSSQYLTINGNTAKQLTFSDGIIITYIYSNNNIFSLAYILETDVQNTYVAQYQNIVRTFKLLEIYKIPELGLKFYPPPSLSGLTHKVVKLPSDQAVSTVGFSTPDLEATGCGNIALGFLTYNEREGGILLSHARGSNLFYIKPTKVCGGPLQDWQKLQKALQSLGSY